MAYEVQSGSAALTPRQQQEHRKTRNSFAKIIIAGIILGVLTISYLISVWNKSEDVSSQILVLLGTGIGYLLGAGRDREDEQ